MTSTPAEVAVSQRVKSLNKKRGTFKTQLKRFQTFMDKTEQLERTSVKCAEVEIKLEKYSQLLQEYEKVTEELEDLIEDADEDEEKERFENEFVSVVARARVYLLPIITQKEMGEDEVGSRNSVTSQDSMAANGLTHIQGDCIRLPTISLPKFSGEYESWLEFRDTFSSLIHTNDKINDVQKFHYLRASLERDASQIIQNIEISETNYKLAWDLICERYNNTSLMVHNHVKAIFEMESVRKESHVELRKILDSLSRHLRSLAALNQPVDHWDTLLIYVITRNLDSTSAREWEKSKSKDNLPTLGQFRTFLKERADLLETLDLKTKQSRNPRLPFKKELVRAFATTSTIRCNYCEDEHLIYNCDRFLKLPVESRRDETLKIGLCFNCLRTGHRTKLCQMGPCRKCRGRHNTLLHVDQEHSRDQVKKDTQRVVLASQFGKTTMLLSTIQVDVLDSRGRSQKCRALLDNGSQSNFISEELCRRLGLQSNLVNLPVVGIGQVTTRISGYCDLTIRSRINPFRATVKCLIIPEITDQIPQDPIDKVKITMPPEVTLADPKFHLPGEIELLLGAEIFWQTLGTDRITLKRGLVAHDTSFGWILGGSFSTKLPQRLVCNFVKDTGLEDQLIKFWETEEIQLKQLWSKEERDSENHFSATIKRNEEGRFIARLPVKEDIRLGDSRKEATRRYVSLEKRFMRQPEIKEQYISFMQDYERLNHMSIVKNETTATNVYYLPHHPVVKADSLSTKLRVVFDGSSKTSSGRSLNDKLLVGPVIQDELFNIIIRFRSHEYVLTADIQMMYRQILINHEDRNYQRILWRNSQEIMQAYTLNTLTYGTSSAPYIATRCLKELARLEGEGYPLGKMALERDFYMDDLLTGTGTKEEAIRLRKELMELLEKGKFPLRKWRSNDLEILESMCNCEEDNLLVIDKEGAIKTLGLLWDSNADNLQYKVTLINQDKITKRSMLSAIARIYDPLGLLGPILTEAKLFMQRLWQLSYDWDSELPNEVQSQWNRYYQGLEDINKIRIPRNVSPNNSSQEIDIYGFCDASELAYGACLYARSVDAHGIITTRLICSKSRVAPIKTLSLPRLELNGAHLLSKLLSKVREALGERIGKIYLWTDSTIVLAWLKVEPNKLKCFVSNRVSQIQSLTEDVSWHHVSSHQNPADVLSRGSSAADLQQNDLWWFGPQFLRSEETHWVEQDLSANCIEDMEFKKIVAFVTTEQHTILNRYSSYQKLLRVVAYIFRFADHARKFPIRRGLLTIEEIDRAEIKVLWATQQEAFEQEYQDLNLKGDLRKTSKLLGLAPFIDENGLLRVGGRLKNAILNPDQKHPVLLPSNHHITNLIIEERHEQLKHCGQEQLLAHLRRKYWPLAGRRTIRKVSRRCLTCYKMKPKPVEYFMGILPQDRVRPCRPFENCGVDYAGPLQLLEGRRRPGRPRLAKAFIAIFVCFATKAVHLELVSNLTAEAFLAALQRFIARRGICSNIYSDNATNFVGANRQLKELYELLQNSTEEITNHLAKRKIKWHFIPPRTPHFGGLWEAAVKAAKRHFTRVTQNVHLTFEEAYTLITEIEAILNSRPLTPLSSNVQDLCPLTPAHFLIGEPLLCPPSPNLTHAKRNQLSRWDHIQKMKQDFWNRWYLEYLQTLQVRQKWKEHTRPLRENDLVLIRDKNLPPMKWLLGRVLRLHPGSDGVPRVATVRTASGELKRGVVTLCPLPVSDGSET